MELNIDDDWCRCQICSRPYSSEVPTSAEAGRGGQEESNLAIPVQSAVCSHVLCLYCVKQQTSGLKPGDGNDEAQNHVVQCPICWRENAFDAKEPIISVMTCNLLKKLQALPTIQLDQLEEDEDDSKKFNLEQERDVNAVITPELNLTEQASLKAAHFTNTLVIYTGDEEPSTVAHGKQKLDDFTYDEQEPDLSQQPFKRVPRGDSSSDDDSFGNNEVAENQDTKVAHLKIKPDTYIARDERPDLSHQLRYNKILDEEELADEVKVVSPTVNTSNENHTLQQPPVLSPPVSQPRVCLASLPGAFPMGGRRFNSSTEDNDSELFLAEATLVIESPIVQIPIAQFQVLPIVHAERLLPFHVKYRRLLCSLLVFVIAIVVLAAIVTLTVQNHLTATPTAPSSSAPSNIIDDWITCKQDVDTCSVNWTCCVASADCASGKTTCRPEGDECSSCRISVSNWETCEQGVDTCSVNWTCCVASADCASGKTTCRPEGDGYSSCNPC
jgi:hypothetical protein